HEYPFRRHSSDTRSLCSRFFRHNQYTSVPCVTSLNFRGRTLSNSAQASAGKEFILLSSQKPPPSVSTNPGLGSPKRKPCQRWWDRKTSKTDNFSKAESHATPPLYLPQSVRFSASSVKSTLGARTARA